MFKSYKIRNFNTMINNYLKCEYKKTLIFKTFKQFT